VFSPEIKRIRKLILYLGLLIYSVVRAIQRPHDLLWVYGFLIFLLALLLVLELLDIFKEMAHKGG
jgi:hypothetical protein